MADKCTPVVSSWLTHVGTWQGKLFCIFKHKGICCWYPNTDESYYDLAITYASKGHFVHQWLYKILPYRIIPNPCAAILGGVTVPCCPGPINSTLHISFTGSADPTCNVSVPLVYVPASGRWEALGFTIGSCPNGVGCSLICLVTSWRLLITGGGQFPAAALSTCSPLALSFGDGVTPIFSNGNLCCSDIGPTGAIVTE